MCKTVVGGKFKDEMIEFRFAGDSKSSDTNRQFHNSNCFDTHLWKILCARCSVLMGLSCGKYMPFGLWRKK